MHRLSTVMSVTPTFAHKALINYALRCVRNTHRNIISVFIDEFWGKERLCFSLHAILDWFLFIERRKGVDTALLAIDKHSI